MTFIREIHKYAVTACIDFEYIVPTKMFKQYIIITYYDEH